MLPPAPTARCSAPRCPACAPAGMLPAAVRCPGRPNRWQPLFRSAAGVIQAPPTTGLQPRLRRSLANLQSLVPLTSHPRPGLADLGGTLSLSRPARVPPRLATLTCQLFRCLDLSLCLFLGAWHFLHPCSVLLSLSTTVSPVPFLTHFTCLSPRLGLSLLGSGFPSPTPPLLFSDNDHLLLTIHALLARQAELRPEVFKHAPEVLPNARHLATLWG